MDIHADVLQHTLPSDNRLVTLDLWGRYTSALMPRYNSKLWPYTIEHLRAMAASDKPLLLIGETGTGKELLAKFLQEQSARNDRPFISVNCSAFTPERMQGDLFGWVHGSFSGAIADMPGPVAEAESGTLFLDELGNLEKPLQGQLLRFMQNGEYRPLGGTLKRGNVRVIAATSKPENIVEDLRQRFAFSPLAIPALRDRGDDVFRLLLLPSFLDQTCFTGITLLTLCRIVNARWPGNIRELSKYCERQAMAFRGMRLIGSQAQYIWDDPISRADYKPWVEFLSFALRRLEHEWHVQPQSFHDAPHIANTVRLLLTLDEYDDPFCLNSVAIPTLHEMLSEEAKGKHVVYDFRFLNQILCATDDRLDQDTARKGGDRALPGALVLIRNYVEAFGTIRDAIKSSSSSQGSVSEEFEIAINTWVRMPNNPLPSPPPAPIATATVKTRKYDTAVVGQVLALSTQGLSSGDIQKRLGLKTAAQVRGILRTNAKNIPNRPRNKGGRPRKTCAKNAKTCA